MNFGKKDAENIVGEGKNAGDLYLLLFPDYFFLIDICFMFRVKFYVMFAIAFKILLSDKVLIYYIYQLRTTFFQFCSRSFLV